MFFLLFFLGQEWEEKRRQNIEKMNEEMERIAEYERGQRVRESLFSWIIFIKFPQTLMFVDPFITCLILLTEHSVLPSFVSL